MKEASCFDLELLKVALHLTDKARRFPTWQTLVNEASRPVATPWRLTP